MRDSANTVISGLTLTSENYKEAIDLLRQQYSNPQVLTSAHMKRFVSLNNVKSVHDVKGLRILSETVESSIRNLKTLKVDVNSYGFLLVPLLNARLPKKLSLLIAQNFEDNVWPLKDMMKVLKNGIQAKERSRSVGTSFDLSDNYCSGDQSFSEDDYTLSALVNSSHKQLKKHCAFCNLKNYKSYKCLHVTEPAAQKRILKQNKNCFICFDFGHVAKSCNWDYKCKKCNGKQHNVSICTFSNNQGDRFNSNGINSENSSSNNLATNSGSILLQTAYTKVANLSTKKEVKVCVLFDTGSQRSYISYELRNYLKLSVLHKESIFIITFGKVEPTIKTVDIVQLKFLSPHKSVVIEAIGTSFICSYILSQNVHSVASQHEHLHYLTLADSSPDRNKRINILVGIDYYHSCINSEIKRGSENQPLAISAIFGWILRGCNETQRNVHTNLNSTHALRLNGDDVINRSCLDKEPFELYFNTVLYNENSNKINEIKDDIYSTFKENLTFGNNRYKTKLPFKVGLPRFRKFLPN